MSSEAVAIHEGMARALFVSAWANKQEEAGKRLPRGDLMVAAPKTNREAQTSARALATKFANANGGKSMVDLYTLAVIAGGKKDPKDFGHYMAMQALGHGVSWFDDNPEFKVKIPRHEFYY